MFTAVRRRDLVATLGVVALFMLYSSFSLGLQSMEMVDEEPFAEFVPATTCKDG